MRLRVLRPLLPAALAAAAVLIATGCGDDGGGAAGAAGASSRVTKVVATTPQVADLARQVGGARAEVTQLLQPGSDPHDYEPRPDDVRAVAEADVVMASGLGLDAWIDEVVQSAGSDARLVRLGDGVPVKLEGGAHAEEEHAGEGERAEEGHAGEEHAGEEHAGEDVDPHWWHEPRNIADAARQTGRALGDASLADRYVAEVRRVGDGIRSCLAAIPAERRKLVTDHDAFAYFAGAYDLEVIGAVIPSTSSQAQASAGAVGRLAATIQEEQVPAVFPERGLNPDLAEAIARRTGARVGGALYADALGEPGTPAATLLGAQAANADTLVRGLTGESQGCGTI